MTSELTMNDMKKEYFEVLNRRLLQLQLDDQEEFAKLKTSVHMLEDLLMPHFQGSIDSTFNCRWFKF